MDEIENSCKGNEAFLKDTFIPFFKEEVIWNRRKD